ncbi:hypothetical protein D9M68_995370 [compost metagenome]
MPFPFLSSTRIPSLGPTQPTVCALPVAFASNDALLRSMDTRSSPSSSKSSTNGNENPELKPFTLTVKIEDWLCSELIRLCAI